MLEVKARIRQKVLVVDDNSAMLEMMAEGLKGKGFEVITAITVAEALHRITAEKFDVLITDLHMPNAGDGFTVISAMRHAQPNALTLLVSGYPDVPSAMAAIVMEADEIIVKPFELGRLAQLVQEKVLARKPAAQSVKESVGTILERCTTGIVGEWLRRAKKSCELNHLELSDGDRTGHLAKLVEDVVCRLRKPDRKLDTGDESYSRAALAHGQLRFEQGYTPAMLVHESRILQVTIFGTLQNNLSFLDFSLLLPDIMTIADEVDAQLTQTMNSFMEISLRTAVA
jgi:DNA-binding response OmpR family regulator